MVLCSIVSFYFTLKVHMFTQNFCFLETHWVTFNMGFLGGIPSVHVA